MPREFAFPGTRDRYAPDRVCDIQHYRIELDLDAWFLTGHADVGGVADTVAELPAGVAVPQLW